MKSILQQHIYGAYKFLRNVSDDEETEQEEEEMESNHAISLIEEDDITKTSNLQTFWNIFNANQGVAILAMPYVVKSGGYFALFGIVALAFVSNFTNKILVQCLYEYSPDLTSFRVRNSYVEIGEAFSPKIGRHLVNAAQIFEQVSYCTLFAHSMRIHLGFNVSFRPTVPKPLDSARSDVAIAKHISEVS